MLSALTSRYGSECAEPDPCVPKAIDCGMPVNLDWRRLSAIFFAALVLRPADGHRHSTRCDL